jgi:hypothetical protein
LVYVFQYRFNLLKNNRFNGFTEFLLNGMGDGYDLTVVKTAVGVGKPKSVTMALFMNPNSINNKGIVENNPSQGEQPLILRIK